ncbi:MAG: hypothetical protein OYH77_00245 [Pseudomonadota bacterium]|nr:hypothetical protein [Pseudomonadota bacterium]
MISVVLQIVAIALLQTTILPALALAAIDLGVIWLVIYAVRAKLSTTVIVAMCLAVVMETRSVAPLGVYFSSYWLIVLAVHALRNIVIWKLSSSWLVAFAVAEMVVLIFESLTLNLINPDINPYLLQCMLRIIATSIAGLIIVAIIPHPQAIARG